MLVNYHVTIANGNGIVTKMKIETLLGHETPCRFRENDRLREDVSVVRRKKPFPNDIRIRNRYEQRRHQG